MKRKRHTPNQIIGKLREAERMLGEGLTTAEAAKALEVSENTFHRWRKQYGGMKAEDVKELKELRRAGRHDGLPQKWTKLDLAEMFSARYTARFQRDKHIV